MGFRADQRGTSARRQDLWRNPLGTSECGSPSSLQYAQVVKRHEGRRMMPMNSGNGQTISGSLRRWRQAGVWGRVMDTLPHWERQSQGRLPAPSACCADSQSIKTATQGEDVGFDGNKKIKGRTRHLLVDTLGRSVAVGGHSSQYG